MRRLLGLLPPVLFAAALVLGIATSGVGQYEGSDLAVVLGVAVAIAAIATLFFLLVVRAFERSDRADPIAVTLAMLFVAWFFFYGPAQRAAATLTWRFSRNAVLVPLGLLATVAIVVWLFRQPARRLGELNGVLTRFGVMLIAGMLAKSAIAAVRTPDRMKASALVRQLEVPLRVAGAPPAERNTPQRDIYLIVLDGHLNGRALKEVLQYDNSAFEDSLRALGFVLPRSMHSNYTQTILSMPSLLNATLLTQLSKDAGENNPSYALPKHLVEHNRTARFLKGQGYKYVLFPSAWWTATQESPIADQTFDARQSFDIRRELIRTELRRAVAKSTLLRTLPGTEVDALFDVRSMAGLRRMAADTAPTFVLAHFLLPHIPYYLDEECRVIPNPLVPGREGSVPDHGRAMYIAQLRCVDRMVLDVVMTLVRNSKPAPVIALVSDHGSRFADPAFMSHPDSVSTAFIRERFAAFGAFHAPAGGSAEFAESVSLVNVMGKVLRYYFNADLPASPDSMFVSGDLPFRFHAVDTTGYVER